MLSLVDFLQEVNVYGVSVPGAEGSLNFKPLIALCNIEKFVIPILQVGKQPVRRGGREKRFC